MLWRMSHAEARLLDYLPLPLQNSSLLLSYFASGSTRCKKRVCSGGLRCFESAVNEAADSRTSQKWPTNNVGHRRPRFHGVLNLFPRWCHTWADTQRWNWTLCSITAEVKPCQCERGPISYLFDRPAFKKHGINGRISVRNGIYFILKAVGQKQDLQISTQSVLRRLCVHCWCQNKHRWVGVAQTDQVEKAHSHACCGFRPLKTLHWSLLTWSLKGLWENEKEHTHLKVHQEESLQGWKACQVWRGLWVQTS